MRDRKRASVLLERADEAVHAIFMFLADQNEDAPVERDAGPDVAEELPKLGWLSINVAGDECSGEGVRVELACLAQCLQC